MENIKVPKALQHLIQSHNEKLQMIQRQLVKEIHEANEEIMLGMGLDPKDGWRIDMEKMEYVQEEISDTSNK
jgi:hypothetical protein